MSCVGDYLFHLADRQPRGQHHGPFTDVDINVNGTLTVLEACVISRR
jgi:nucleoside-diphosphate-sugar epimerase